MKGNDAEPRPDGNVRIGDIWWIEEATYQPQCALLDVETSTAIPVRVYDHQSTEGPLAPSTLGQGRLAYSTGDIWPRVVDGIRLSPARTLHLGARFEVRLPARRSRRLAVATGGIRLHLLCACYG